MRVVVRAVQFVLTRPEITATPQQTRNIAANSGRYRLPSRMEGKMQALAVLISVLIAALPVCAVIAPL